MLFNKRYECYFNSIEQPFVVEAKNIREAGKIGVFSYLRQFNRNPTEVCLHDINDGAWGLYVKVVRGREVKMYGVSWLERFVPSNTPTLR